MGFSYNPWKWEKEQYHAMMLKTHHTTFSLIIRIIDALLLPLSLFLVFQIYNLEEWHLGYTVATMFTLVISPTVLQLHDAYRPWRSTSFYVEFKVLFLACLSISLILVSLAFISKTSDIFSRVIVSSWFFLGLGSLTLAHWLRRLLLRYLRSQGKNTRTAIIIGAGSLGCRLAKRVTGSPWMGINILGFFDDQEGVSTAGLPPFLGNGNDAVSYVQDHHVDIVYFALPMHSGERMKELMIALQDTTATVYLLPDIFMFDLLHTQMHDIDGIPVLALCDTPLFGLNQMIKRLEDLVLASFIILLISPLMLFIAVTIKVTSPGPVIFKQRRYGLKGNEVMVWKFRSMTVCEDSGAIQQAGRNDARVTPFGAVLRRTSMDEFPQFFNVIQGHMSIVGPRPHAVSHNEEYRKLIKAYMWRHKVKPGITGWAQVNGWRGETDTLYKMEKRVEYDLWYIRHWSLWLDINIIWRTIVGELIGKSKNAY